MSGAGARLCETCGQPIPPAGPAGKQASGTGTPVLDYRTGSFTDFVEGADTAGEPGSFWEARLQETMPDIPAVPHPEGEARAGAAPGGKTAGAPGEPGPRQGHARTLPGEGATRQGHRRRFRLLVTAVGLAVLAAAILGARGLLHHPSPAVASARRSSSASARSSAPSSPSPAASHASASPTAPAAGPPGGSSGWTSPRPVGPALSGATLTGVSCPRPAQCYAADSAGVVLSSTTPGTWKAAASDSSNGLVAISCADTTSCLALDSAGNVLILGPNGWSGPVYVDSRAGVFTAVSCPLPSFCMAVDSGGNAFAYHGPSRGWQPFTVDTVGGGLTGVSCTSASFCVAVDTGGGAYVYDGSSWAGPSPVDVGHPFTGVSCASPAFCVAIGTGGNAAVFTGGHWSVGPMGTSADAIACPESGYCVAVTGAGGALTYRGGHWSAVTRIDPHTAIGALSCPAPRACTALDKSGNALYYGSPAGG